MRTTIASVTLLLMGINASAQNVNVPDVALQEVLRDRLFLSSADPITRDDMLRLPEVFVISGASIRNLQGLEFATNVRELVIEDGLIGTFEPLANLTNLTRLDLRGNPVTSIAPVREMTALTTLQIDSETTPGSLRSLCPLLDHPSIQVVSFVNQNISDVCPLGSLPNLSDANLAENPIANISALTDSPFLTDADDTEFITLRDTDLDNFDCADIEFLLDNSVRLDLTGTMVTCTTFPPIKGIGPSTLPDCNCAGVGEGEGEGEGELDCVDGEVFFADPDLEDVVREALGQFKGSISTNQLEALDELVATQRGIDSLIGLQCALNLEVLVVSLNNIETLAPIENLPQLRVLDVSRNSLQDIFALEGMERLESLDISESSIVSLEPLFGMTSLRTLAASGNPAPDINPLVLSAALEEVDLEQMGIVDISVLAELPLLNRINLRGNPIVMIDPLLNNPGLGPGDRVDLIGTFVQGSECSNVAELTARGVIVLAPGACIMGEGGGCPRGDGSKTAAAGSNGLEAAALAMILLIAARRRRGLK